MESNFGSARSSLAKGSEWKASDTRKVTLDARASSDVRSVTPRANTSSDPRSNMGKSTPPKVTLDASGDARRTNMSTSDARRTNMSTSEARRTNMSTSDARRTNMSTSDARRTNMSTSSDARNTSTSARRGNMSTVSEDARRTDMSTMSKISEGDETRQPMKITHLFSGPDLLNLSIFENFTGNPQHVERLFPVFNKRILQEDAELSGPTFCFVVWGIGDVYLNGTLVDSRVTGDVFNEMLLIDESLCTQCTMIARTAMVIFECTSAEFQEALTQTPSFQKYIDDIRANHGYDLAENESQDLMVSAVRSCSYFQNCEAIFVEKLVSMLCRQLFFPNEQIPRKKRGESRKSIRDLLIVNFGMVNMTMHGHERMLSRHDTINELALFGLPSDSFTACAVTTVDVFYLHHDVFKKLIRDEAVSDFDDLLHNATAQLMAKFSVVKALQKTKFFANTSTDFLQYVATKWDTRLIVKNTMLDLQRDICLVVSGEICVGDKEKYRSGQLIILRKKNLSKADQGVMATKACVVKILSYNMLLHCVSHFPDDRHYMARAIATCTDLNLDLKGLGNVPQMLQAALSSVLGTPLESSSESFFKEIQCVAEERIFFQRECIVEKGQLGSWASPSMFVLCSGEAEVVNDDMVVASLKAPTAFGELVLLGITEERTATIRVKEDCQCFCMEIKRHTLFPLLLKYPETKHMFATLAARYLVSSVCNCVDAAPIFSDVAVKFRTMVAMYSSHIVLFQECLCSQGDAGDAMYIINNGNLSVCRNSERVCTLNPEHTFAAHLAFCGLKDAGSVKDVRLRTHWGRAHTEGVCSLIRVSRTIMAKALDRFPQYLSWARKRAEMEARRVVKFITQGEWRHHRRRLQQVLCNDGQNAEGKVKKDLVGKVFQLWKTFYVRCRLVRTRRQQQTLRLQDGLAQWLAHHRRGLQKKKAAEREQRNRVGDDKDVGLMAAAKNGVPGMVIAGWPTPKRSPFYDLGLPKVWNKLPPHTHDIQCCDVLEARGSMDIHSALYQLDSPERVLPEPTLLLRMAESCHTSPSSRHTSPGTSPRYRRMMASTNGRTTAPSMQSLDGDLTADAMIALMCDVGYAGSECASPSSVRSSRSLDRGLASGRRMSVVKVEGGRSLSVDTGSRSFGRDPRATSCEAVKEDAEADDNVNLWKDVGRSTGDLDILSLGIRPMSK